MIETNVRWMHSKYASDDDRIALNKTMKIPGFHLEHEEDYTEPWMLVIA